MPTYTKRIKRQSLDYHVNYINLAYGPSLRLPHTGSPHDAVEIIRQTSVSLAIQQIDKPLG